ncbi:cobalamin (vitamin B12) biosynthesis CbiM protein [Spirochaeta thermophila DSM 6578]|uniref:Cobalamin (Vitamin B12) biosynthesis CbiM protein n=1 Tax=Winmispira thermophila (strain ATCC 700085 / DSM 6578 / Z-1203) TaxID=869211 RepID=G0GAC4_WINT7|nr:energy-coupling factor ABC transporter permease [Spirochaeta thermophila]AEJ61743.1 cobalamin (vitamin B12) biosynthesis CbiM protein [Spirochaeta thermophila DSM 6578]
MHIPSHVMSHARSGAAGGGIAGLLTVGVAWWAARSERKPDGLLFASVTALVFALEMLNVPVQHGTSGHIIGTVLAIGVLGAPFGLLSMVLVLSLQALVFADGGLASLGWNVINMAFVAALPALFLVRKDRPVSPLLWAIAGWASVVLAALACALELAYMGIFPAREAVPAMVGVHALVGFIEGAGTALLVPVLSRMGSEARTMGWLAPGLGALVGVVLFAPLASPLPDGLEWVLERFAHIKEVAPSFVSPLADYTVPGVANPFLSTILAGMVGVVLTFGLAWGVGWFLGVRRAG